MSNDYNSRLHKELKFIWFKDAFKLMFPQDFPIKYMLSFVVYV